MSAFNAFQRRDESVSGSERTMMSCYQKRADLVSNLANTVERMAGHEKDVQTQVTQARASVGSSHVTLNSEADAAKFAESQRAIAGMTQQLLAVAERYPDIKSAANFLLLQKQLKEIETQCTIVRNKYIQEVRAYNVNIRSFPSNVVANYMGYTVKPQLQFDNEPALKQSPRVFEKK